MQFQSAVARFFADGRAFPVLLLIFFGSAFFLRPAPVWALVFYVGVLPATLYRLWRVPAFKWRDGHIILVFVVILWSALTLLWGEDPGGGRVLKCFLGAVWTAIYFIAVVTVLRDDRENRRRIETVLIFAGAVNAALSIVLYVHSDKWHLSGARLVGWAETRHSILGAMLIAVCFLCATDRVLGERKHRLAHTIAAAVCLAFIVMTKSRGPLLAVGAAAIVLTYGYSRRLGLAMAGIALVGAVGVAIAATYHPAFLPEQLQELLVRPSYRVYVWSFTLKRVAQRPLFGHGVAAYLGMPWPFTFPHGMFISALFYTGVIGLALLVALVISITAHLVRAWNRAGTPLLFALWVNVLCGGMTDIGKLITGPSPLWFFFWLPVALICTHLTAEGGGGIGQE